MNRLVLATLLASGAESFVTCPHTQHCSSTTSLSALPPPLIIGPMLKKMQEDKMKKKMPMADPSEAANEAPGLRVGATAWKWPPIWPYDAGFFVTAKSFEQSQQKKQMSQMTSTLTGIAQIPKSDQGMVGANATALTNGAADTKDAQDVFNPLKYWGEDVAQVTTDMDPDAVAKLKAHYDFYLKDGISILELGAAEDSYLPDSIKPSRHVGVGANPIMMKKNPSLTETLVVDLNKVVEGRDVDNDDFRRLAQEPFDAVIMANTVDFLTSPREVFRSAWYLLKPGGQMIVAFSGKEGTKDKFPDATTKMWNDFNDDQHLWMTGSFFQFSAGDGWESLRGFDISPDSAKKETEGAMALLDKGKNNNLYVVQAIKGYQDEKIDPENAERSIQSLCWMLPVLEQRDKDLVVPRLARVYETADDDAIRSAIERNVQKLPSIYEALVKMDRFEFSFTMQAQLATDLVCDPDFGGTEEELLALKQGLGLRKPSEEFWAPIGQLTAKVPVEEKISLLGYMVPCFGSDDPEQERALQDYVSGLKPTYATLRSKCPDLPESDIEMLGAELLAYEILKPGRSSKEDFAAWLATMTGEELKDMLAVRKSYREVARAELAEFREERAAAEAKRQDYLRRMEEQKEHAFKVRSMVFNPRTEKFELYDNPNKKEGENKKWFGFGP